MTNPATAAPHPRNRPRSVGAIAIAFVAVVVLSLATDQVLHMMNVYPPWGQPMYDPGLNMLALTYRIVYGVLGGYIAAKLAPHSPMRHAMILGVIGFVVSVAGAIAAIGAGNLGPNWYPIALALTAIPTAWLGGSIYERKRRLG